MYYSEQEARKLVLKAGLMLVEKKLIARTWGNVSARISDDEFIITPSGLSYENLKESDLVKVRISDLSYDGNIKPSSERKLHAGSYQLRKDCLFIIHTHQFYASAICAEEQDTEFSPCASYGLSGTKKLKNNVCNCIIEHPESSCFLMAKHGVVVLGLSFEDAFEKAQDLEEKCKALFEKEKHEERKGSFIDDYAQMFDRHGNASDKEEKVYVDLVREKNRAASCYVKRAKPLSRFICMLEHLVYTKKYSKQKDKV